MARFGLSQSQATMLVFGFLATANMHLLLFSYSPLLRDIAFELNLNDAQAGIVFSVCILTLMLFRIPWGIVYDRKGFKKTMLFGLLLMGIFGLLRGFAFDYGTLLASQFLLGAGLSATIPCLPKLVSEWFPQEKAGLATGACMAGFPVGDILALNVTPYLQTFLNDWRQPLQVYGVWTFILVGLWWKFTHGNPEKRNRAESFSKPLKQDLKALFRMKEVWLLTGLYFCASGCFDTALLWLPDILQSKGTSPYAASIIASMLPIGFLVASATVGVFSDKIGLRRPFIMILGLVSGPAIYLTGAVLGPTTYVTVFLAGFCTVGTLTLTLTIPVEMPSISSRESSALGLISAIGNAGSLLLPTIIGQIRDVTGTFLLATLILAITGECIFVLGLALTETGTKGKKHV